jgi:molybdenum cofactor biosynthesis enzyme MoaA
MSDIIFYGAGGAAKGNYDRLTVAGVKPVCFADANEALHYTRFASHTADNIGGEEILPLREAIKRYPDYLIVPTIAPDMRSSVIAALTGGRVELSRIKTLEDFGFEWRRGCTQLDRYFAYFGDSMSTCCSIHGPIIKCSGDLAKDFDALREKCEAIVAGFRAGKAIDCDSCGEVYYGYYAQKPEFTHINISASKGMRCNLKCFYCSERLMLDESGEMAYEVYDFIKQLSELTDIRRIWFSNGEISVNPDAGAVLEFVEKRGYDVTFITNCVVYREEIGRMLGSGDKYMIITSLDCGTRESFARIKGVDRFDKTVQNIKRYAATGGRVQLKYVLLEGLNDNEADMDGFLDLCAEINPCVVGVGTDFFKRDEKMSDTLFDKFRYLLRNLERQGRHIEFQTAMMYPEDHKRAVECCPSLH